MAKLSERLQFFEALGGESLVQDIRATDRAFEQARKTFTDKSQSAKTTIWASMGALSEYRKLDDGLLLHGEQGWIRLLWLAPNCLHVLYASTWEDFADYQSIAVDKTDWPPMEIEVEESPTALVVQTTTHQYRIERQALRLHVETLDGAPVCSDSQGMAIDESGQVRLSMKLAPDEACYGLGERAARLNLRGKRLSLWNTDPAVPYQRGDDPLYYCIPFYLGLHNNGVYGLLWDNSNRGWVDLGAEHSDELRFQAEAGRLSYYLFAGSDVNSVLARYQELTGRIQLPPLWFLGYHQCRFSYRSQGAVLMLAQEFRQRGIPCDSIYLDIHYMDRFRVFSHDRDAFPAFEEMIASLHKMGFHVVVIVDPAIKVAAGYDVYESGLEHDVFLKYPDGSPVTAAVWPGSCHFPDFAKDSTREWWKSHIKGLIDSGVDGVWNDMCEPVVFKTVISDTLPDFVVHEDLGAGTSHVANHNLYGMLMAGASSEALNEYNVNQKRPANMTRAGYAGTQRYAASWTGDNTASWDHVRLSLSMALNMGLSGAAMTGPDIGGFHDNADGELFTRWLQACCLFPYFRGHSSFGTSQHEPWAFGQPYEVINRLTIQLRYRLMPYLYSVVAQCAEYGWPVIRPLLMLEPENTTLRNIDDSYLLGDSLMVAPVLEQGATSRNLYLPAGSDWYDYWTNERFSGNQVITVPAPLERLPLFVRAGTVLPIWPDMQYSGEISPEALVLRAYPGTHETTLYEDDGKTTAFRDGDYRWIYVTAVEDGEVLSIKRRIAGSYTPAYTDISLEVIGLDSEPSEVRVDRHGAAIWFYDEGLLEISAGMFQSIEITRRASSSDATLLRRPW